MKLWMLTEITGEAPEAIALVWADDPGEARWLLQEKTSRHARVCVEIWPEKDQPFAALIGFGATEEAAR